MREHCSRSLALVITVLALSFVGGWHFRAIKQEAISRRSLHPKALLGSRGGNRTVGWVPVTGNGSAASKFTISNAKKNRGEPSVQVAPKISEAVQPSGDASIGTLSRVALLFLSRGPMPHEPSWKQFFQAAGRLKLGVSQSPPSSRHIPRGQQLFSAYLHAAPDYKAPDGSLFSTLQLENPVQAEWGQHSLAEAERRLYIAALRDRANARFVLLSELCVFLYPPATVYLESLAAHRSRINACILPVVGDWRRRNVHRLQKDMVSDKLNETTWRKSSQWKVLNRKHAALVAGDSDINSLFVRGCWVDPGWPQTRFCVSDEHYVPSLLAAHGMDNETDCTGGGTYAMWQHIPGRPPSPHPKTWTSASEVTEDLINALRIPPYAAKPSGTGCNYTAAIESSTYLMTHGVPDAPATVSHGIVSDLWHAMPLPVQQLLPGSSRSGPRIVRRRQLRSYSVSDSDMSKSALVIGGDNDVDSWRLRPSTWPHSEGEEVSTWQRKLQIDLYQGRPSVPSKNTSWVGVPQLLQDPYADDQLLDDSATLVSQYESMGHACPLFARKFAPSTSEQLALVTQQYIVR